MCQSQQRSARQLSKTSSSTMKQDAMLCYHEQIWGSLTSASSKISMLMPCSSAICAAVSAMLWMCIVANIRHDEKHTASVTPNVVPNHAADNNSQYFRHAVGHSKPPDQPCLYSRYDTRLAVDQSDHYLRHQRDVLQIRVIITSGVRKFGGALTRSLARFTPTAIFCP